MGLPTYALSLINNQMHSRIPRPTMAIFTSVFPNKFLKIVDTERPILLVNKKCTCTQNVMGCVM